MVRHILREKSFDQESDRGFRKRDCENKGDSTRKDSLELPLVNSGGI
jgi:hypothetical protein